MSLYLVYMPEWWSTSGSSAPRRSCGMPPPYYAALDRAELRVLVPVLIGDFGYVRDEPAARALAMAPLDPGPQHPQEGAPLF